MVNIRPQCGSLGLIFLFSVKQNSLSLLIPHRDKTTPDPKAQNDLVQKRDQ